MFPQSNALTLTKVISGISKSINIVNQIIPLYEQTKPMINNAKTVINFFKNSNSNTTSIKTTNPQNDLNRSTKKVVTNNNNFNNPTFFK